VRSLNFATESHQPVILEPPEPVIRIQPLSMDFLPKSTKMVHFPSFCFNLVQFQSGVIYLEEFFNREQQIAFVDEILRVSRHSTRESPRDKDPRKVKKSDSTNFKPLFTFDMTNQEDANKVPKEWIHATNCVCERGSTLSTMVALMPFKCHS
jgi:hypothetical protein